MSQLKEQKTKYMRKHIKVWHIQNSKTKHTFLHCEDLTRQKVVTHLVA